jgi:hypothetical protein
MPLCERAREDASAALFDCRYLLQAVTDSRVGGKATAATQPWPAVISDAGGTVMPEPWESLTSRILYMLLFSRDLDADVDRVARYVCTRPLGGSLSAHREQLVAAVNARPLR